MARLHIIDQSLCNKGGHHFDYVNCIARTANQNRFETFVATNRRFKLCRENPQTASQSLLSVATVVPSFKNTTYQRESWLSGLRHLKRAEMVTDKSSSANGTKTSLLKKCTGWRRSKSFRSRRRKLIAQFAQDCQRYFGSLSRKEFMPDDHVFLTTVSELEMMGLAIYLASTPSSRLANWHLQFHYNLFDGRTPEFDAQTEVQRKVRGCFLAAMSRVPDHKLNFYCTSSELVEQYSRLKVADFYRLPYPINHRFAPKEFASAVPKNTILKLAVHDTGDPQEIGSGIALSPIDPVETETAAPRFAQSSSPIRMVCPGELRREKGSAAHLQRVIDSLWDEYLSCGRLQVAVQRPKRKLLRKQKLSLSVPGHDNSASNDPVIDYLQHPLSETEYCDFVRGSDFGLLLYDSRAYYSRRAGVLGELMACGKPVIVPAGCWLAHQLQEPQFQHVDALMKELPHSRRLELGSFEFASDNAPLSGGIVSFDRQRHPFKATASKTTGENIAIVSFDWHHPRAEGVDVRIRCIETCPDGSSTVSTQVVGHRYTAGQCRTLFRVGRDSTKVCFEFENAFHDSTAMIQKLSVDLYCVPDSDEVPLGNVGLIFAGEDTIEDSVIEMMEHLEHYQRSAQKFSHAWWRAHDPVRTLGFLTDGPTVGRRAA